MRGDPTIERKAMRDLRVVHHGDRLAGHRDPGEDRDDEWRRVLYRRERATIHQGKPRQDTSAEDVATYVGPASATSTLFVVTTPDGLRAQSTFASSTAVSWGYGKGLESDERLAP